LRDFESFPLSMFMWRALTMWVGGVGIILIFIAVFPQLAIAGRQLFSAETPGVTDDRLTPRLRMTANRLLLVYAGLTLACIVGYLFGGMDLFTAVAHAFATLAAGGFSPNPRSFEGTGGAPSDWFAILFMF